MSSSQLTHPLLAGIHRIRSSWGWFLALGIVLIVLGAVCIAGEVLATFATILVLGWLLLFSGVVALVHAFQIHNWQGFFMYLLSALLRGFTGYALIRYPLAGAVALTLVLAAFFIVGGLSRAIGAVVMKFPRWGWAVFAGVVAVALGIMLLEQLPVSSVWFIGFAIGVDMILEGVSLIGFATAIHKLPEVVAYDRAA
jgi:uncharacterized membrane protein HdeD (DUF308 family)